MIFSYIRTSFWKEDKVTLKMQQEAINSKTEEMGFSTIDPENIFEDRGISGGKFHERKGLQALLNELRKPSAYRSTLIVYRFNRLSRNTNAMMTILEILEENEVELISVMEPIPEFSGISQKKMMIYIYSIVATFEREVSSENKLLGLEQKRLKGKPLVNNPPYGYSYTKDNLELIDSEIGVVRLVYDLYLTGKFGYKKIAKQLNKKGLKYGNRSFTDLDIYNILSNKTYYGVFKGGDKVGEYRGNHETVISEKEFERVQELRKKRHIHKKNFRKNWLQKKIACPACGQNLTPKTVQNQWGKYSYYFCAKRTCVERDLDAEELEQNVKNEIIKFITKSSIIDYTLEELYVLKNVEENQIHRSERKIKRDKKRIFKEFEEGQLTADEFTKQLSLLKDKLTISHEVNRNIMKKEYLEALLEQQTSIKEGRVKDSFYFNLVELVELDEDYQLDEIYLKSLDMNIMKQEELVL